jgi:iron complex transport system ATP-binding protein
MENVLFTENLTIGYQTKREPICVAKNLNIGFKKGKLTALVGENGIGKSTLLRTLTGIQKPILGKVFLTNKSIAETSNLEKAQKLSLVLTEKLPPSNLSVFEVVALGRQPYTNWLGKLSEVDFIAIENAITATKIKHLIQKKHFEISDGQLQIVLIARALAQNTAVIVLDEPTTHLDLPHKIEVLLLLKKLAAETQKCILFSTHDIDLAIQLSDEMTVMTKTNIYQNTPCNLIEANVFNELFQNESLVFDKVKGKFVVI